MKRFMFLIVFLLSSTFVQASCDTLADCEALKDNLSQQLASTNEAINAMVESMGINGLEAELGIGPVEVNIDGSFLTFGDDVESAESYCLEKYGTQLVSYEQYQRYAAILGTGTLSGYQNVDHPESHLHWVLVGGHERAVFDFYSGFIGDDGRDFAYLHVRCSTK